MAISRRTLIARVRACGSRATSSTTRLVRLTPEGLWRVAPLQSVTSSRPHARALSIVSLTTMTSRRLRASS